jgi:hypothetical protein
MQHDLIKAIEEQQKSNTKQIKRGLVVALLIPFLGVVAFIAVTAWCAKSCSDAGGIGNIAGEIVNDFEKAKNK